MAKYIYQEEEKKKDLQVNFEQTLRSTNPTAEIAPNKDDRSSYPPASKDRV